MRTCAWLAAAALAASAPMTFGAQIAAGEQHARTYALVAAVGSQVTTIQERQATGSHLSPYRRSTFDVPGNLLNKLALHSLDRAIAGVDRESRRVYLAVSDRRIDEAHPSDRDEIAFARVLEELKGMDKRGDWYRIVVATPAYRAQAKEGLGARVEGFGLFSQPLCQSDQESCEHGFRPAAGARSRTSSGEEIEANYYIAPYSALRIRVLDPQTLEVIDSREVVGHAKIADEFGGTTRLEPADLASGMFSVIERSVREAVRDSELRGRVEVGPVRPVPTPQER